MDLSTVTAVRSPTSRADLAITDSEALLGGGSWLFSEPQLGVTALVDLTRLRWPPITLTGRTLSIASTCTFAELAAWASSAHWPTASLVRRCCEALLGSFKVWNLATVGGNICLALPAGPMTSLMATLDAEAVIWRADATTARTGIVDLVTGVQRTTLGHGDVLRSIEVPLSSLASTTGFRRIALSPLGRSGTLVTARLDADGVFTLTVTAGTTRPERLAFESVPTSAELARAVEQIASWYDDAHGAPDWRAAMTALFAQQLREELAP